MRDFGFFIIVFAVLFGGGYLYTAAGGFSEALRYAEPVIAVALICAFVLAALYWRRAWHHFANNAFVGAPQILATPWVIDGDTVDDRATGVRYRLANIDAPEIDGAKCYREAERGQLAKWALVRLVREARAVSVRKTFRIDRYGRRVAFLLIDGKDAGAELMARGLAVPWRGWRRRWCGPRGGLALLGKTSGMAHACKKCRAFN